MTADQPQLVVPKSLVASKTLWLNLLAPVFMWLAVKYGINLDDQTKDEIITVAMMVGLPLANILMRLVTQGPVAVLAPLRNRQSVPLDGTYVAGYGTAAPILLPPGVHEITVPSPPTAGPQVVVQAKVA